MTKTSAEIELEVEATRGNLDRTVEALKGKMSPGQLVDEVSTLMGSGGRQVLSRLGEQARENPMPLAVMGVGLAWLMMGNRHAGSRHDYRGGGAILFSYHHSLLACTEYKLVVLGRCCSDSK